MYATLVLDTKKTDLSKQWTVTDMADAIKGMSINVGDHVVEIPRDRQTRDKLPKIFAHPITLPNRGYVVSLADTGETGPRGKPVRYFKTEKITPDTGNSVE